MMQNKDRLTAFDGCLSFSIQDGCGLFGSFDFREFKAA